MPFQWGGSALEPNRNECLHAKTQIHHDKGGKAAPGPLIVGFRPFGRLSVPNSKMAF
jgi:hypothetical protein